MDSTVGGWPGYEHACMFCGAGCRAIDRFCSQCGRPDPCGRPEVISDEMLIAPTIVIGPDEDADLPDATFLSTRGTAEKPRTTVSRRRKKTEAQQRRTAELRAMLLPGAVFGRRYRIQRFLGAGAMGTVCSAIDESIDEVVALKILSAPIQEDPESFERFKLELKLARKIRHRNVVQSFDLGFADGYPYISMEYIDADNMLKHLHRRELFDEATALGILRQVLRGLRAAHDLGIVHRDIKPENILLNKDLMAFITDFGIAVPANITNNRELAGTPDYMAPEQLRCEAVSAASDLYSCGVLLYRMLTGKLPFKAESITQIITAHLHVMPEPIPDSIEVSDTTREMIQWMLQKEVQDRPADARVLLEQIDGMLRRATLGSRSRRLKVLVIEHDPAALELIRTTLEADGYRVLAADNAKDGVNLAFEQSPSLILLDAKIGGGFALALDENAEVGADGLGFFRIVQADEKLKRVPIVVMTEKTLTALDRDFHDSGAADIIIKPLGAEDVLGAVRKLLPTVVAG